MRRAGCADAAGGRVLLFGGGWVLGDTWAFDGTSWELLQEADPAGILAPAPRMFSDMVSDTSSGRQVLFGGLSDDVTFGDTWVWTRD